MSIKQEANIAICMKQTIEQRQELSDLELEKILRENYQFETTGAQRIEIYKNTDFLINHVEIRTNSDKKLIFSWKDELTLKAEKCSLTNIEASIFKQIKESGRKGSRAKFMREKLHIPQREMSAALKSLISLKLISEVKVGKQKLFHRPDIELDESILGGFWQDEDDLKFDQDSIRICRSMVTRCLANKADLVKKQQEKDPTIIPFGEYVSCSVKEVTDFIASKDLFRGKNPREKDVSQILEILVYEGLVNKVTRMNLQCYYLVKNIAPDNLGFCNVPCSNCTLMNVCRDKGVSSINPVDCEYLNNWLDL